MSGEPVYAGARRPRARLPVVFAAVAVVLAGTFVWQSLTRDDQERRPTAETRRPAVPASWRSFQDPDGTYRLSFPPTWTPTDRGPFIDFTEPGGERFFRVQPTTDGLAPLVAQRNLERAFMARHPGDGYRRLRLGSTTFRSVPAAEWEFTFLDEGRPTRGYDITFIAAGRRHAILFQAPANRWAGSRDELQSFLAGFRPRGYRPAGPLRSSSRPAARDRCGAAAAGAVHRLQGLDQDLALGVAQRRVGVGQQVAAGRHLGVGDHLGGVVGLAVVLVPGGEVERLAALLDVAGHHPGERRDVALRRPAGLVAVAVVAGRRGQLPGPPVRPGSVLGHGRVGVVAPVRHQLQQHGHGEQPEPCPDQDPAPWCPHPAPLIAAAARSLRSAPPAGRLRTTCGRFCPWATATSGTPNRASRSR